MVMRQGVTDNKFFNKWDKYKHVLLARLITTGHIWVFAVDQNTVPVPQEMSNGYLLGCLQLDKVGNDVLDEAQLSREDGTWVVVDRRARL